MRQKREKGNYHGNYVPFHSWKLVIILDLASFRLSLTLSSFPGKYLWTLFPMDRLQGTSYKVPRTWKSGTWLDARKEITFIRPPFIIIVYWPQLLWSISIAVARHCYRDWGDKSRYNRQASQPLFSFFHALFFFPILLQVFPGILLRNQSPLNLVSGWILEEPKPQHTESLPLASDLKIIKVEKTKMAA